MRKTVFKWTVALAALVFLLAAAAGCGGVDDFLDGEPDVTDEDLLVWSVDPLVGNYSQRLKLDPADPRALMTKDVVQNFQNAHGVNVVIRNVGWGIELQKQLRNAIATNTMPDITVGEQFVRLMVENSQFEPLDLGDSILNNLSPRVKEVGTSSKDGKLYAAAWAMGNFVLTVNLKVLRDNGVLTPAGAVDPAWRALDPTYAEIDPLAPDTWEDLLEVCKYLKSKMGSGGGGMLMSNTKSDSAWRALAFMGTAKGDFLDANGDVKMNSPENKKAFEMMRRFAETAPANSINATAETGLWRDYLFKNKAAYIVEGIDILTSVQNDADLDIKDYLASELPTFEAGGVKSNVLVGSGYYSISKTCNKKAVALEFIKYLLSDAVQLKVMEADMRVPSMKNVLDSDAIRALPNYALMRACIDPFNDPDYTFKTFPGFEDNASEIWEKWDTFSGALLKAGGDGNYADLTVILDKAHSDMLGKQKGML
ncbi:MAG: extracellular solute-binding protein [Clostridiales bacterium]|jgi:ABC-type glycerol-3-phosphate transport system substrate-binding protein|nr:extracellular solute-binding protein [Clostridiales bacterium]